MTSCDWAQLQMRNGVLSDINTEETESLEVSETFTGYSAVSTASKTKGKKSEQRGSVTWSP